MYYHHLDVILHFVTLHLTIFTEYDLAVFMAEQTEDEMNVFLSLHLSTRLILFYSFLLFYFIKSSYKSVAPEGFFKFAYAFVGCFKTRNFSLL